MLFHKAPTPPPEPVPETPSHPSVEVNTELRDIFNPLCIAAAEVAQPEAIAAREPELFGEVANLPEHVIPNDDMFIAMPWDMTVGTDMSEWLTIKADLRTAREKNDGWSEEWSRAFDKMLSFEEHLEKSYAERHPEADRDDMREIEYEVDKWFGRKGSSFDLDTWETYEQYVAQLGPTEQAEIETYRKLRRTNVYKAYWFSDEMQTSERSIFAHNRHAQSKDLTSNLAVPVGEYGAEFAQRNVAAAALIQAAASANVQQIAAQVIEGHEATLREYTARAAEAPEVNAATTMETLQEGILSVMQSVAILTQEKVEGYDDPVALLEDIVRSGLIERLARYAPMGFVGPMALSGKYWPNTLVKTDAGVAFSESFEGYLKEQRDKYVGEFVVRANSESLPEGVSRAIGRVCPVSGKGGGIQAIANTYLALVKSPRVQTLALAA